MDNFIGHFVQRVRNLTTLPDRTNFQFVHLRFRHIVQSLVEPLLYPALVIIVRGKQELLTW